MRSKTKCSSTLRGGFHAARLGAIVNCNCGPFSVAVNKSHALDFSLAIAPVRRNLSDPKMDAELEKLVESGKLTSKAAQQLDKLKPGTFCLHKSWGFGRVAEWNLLLNQIVIDFAGKKGHSMQLQYAAENLTLIPLDHFLARKKTDLASIKKLAREDPAALMRNILESLNGEATPDQIGEWLIGDVFILTDHDLDMRTRLKIEARMWEKIGEQKIDILIEKPDALSRFGRIVMPSAIPL